MIHRHLVRPLLLAVLPLFAACGNDAADSSKTAGRSESAREADGNSVREVSLVRAESARLSRTVSVSGTLAADEQAELALKVAGRIAALNVDLGSPVRRGQVLARLIPSDFELRIQQAEDALAQAQARLGLAPGSAATAARPEASSGAKEALAVLEQAKVSQRRMQSLFDQGLISRSELDSANAALGVADARYDQAMEEARNRQGLLDQRRSELEIARKALADSVLTAPFDGTIRERQASVGDYVAVGQTVVVLVKVHPLRLRLAVPEREATALRRGQKVELTVEGDPAVHAGTVRRLSPAITESNRTLLVEAEVPNPTGSLRPGAFARAEIVVEDEADAPPAVLVPSSAVVSFAGIYKVLKVENGKAVEQRVKLGRRSGDRVEVIEGVTADEALVSQPGNLVNGEPVKVIDAQAG